jgi:hypothetical protein
VVGVDSRCPASHAAEQLVEIDEIGIVGPLRDERRDSIEPLALPVLLIEKGFARV